MPLSPMTRAILAASQNQGRMTVGSGLMALGRSIGAAISQYKHNKKMEEGAEEAFPYLDLPDPERQEIPSYEGESPLMRGMIAPAPQMAAGGPVAAKPQPGFGRGLGLLSGAVQPGQPGRFNLGMDQMTTKPESDEVYNMKKNYLEQQEALTNQIMDQYRRYYMSDDPEERKIALDAIRRRATPTEKKVYSAGGYVWMTGPDGQPVQLGPERDVEHYEQNGKHYIVDINAGKIGQIGDTGVKWDDGKIIDLRGGERETLPDGTTVEPMMKVMMTPDGELIPLGAGKSNRLGAGVSVDVSTNINDKPARDELQKEALKMYLTSDRLIDDMRYLLGALNERPEMLDTPERVKNFYRGVMMKFGPAVLDAVGITEDKIEAYQDAKEFYRGTNEVITRYIRQMTGAQMSAYEIDRLMAAMPNASDNRWEFQAKAQDVIQLNYELMQTAVKLMNMALSEEDLATQMEKAFQEKMEAVRNKWGVDEEGNIVDQNAHENYIEQYVTPLKQAAGKNTLEGVVVK